MTDISDRYLDRYRRRLSDLESVDKELKDLRNEYDNRMTEINQRRMRVDSEIRDMRQVITTMIDQGCDPVEAKLRNDNDTRNTIWDIKDINWDSKMTIGIDPVYPVISSVDLSMDTSELFSDTVIYDTGGSSGPQPDDNKY